MSKERTIKGAKEKDALIVYDVKLSSCWENFTMCLKVFKQNCCYSRENALHLTDCRHTSHLSKIRSHFNI